MQNVNSTYLPTPPGLNDPVKKHTHNTQYGFILYGCSAVIQCSTTDMLRIIMGNKKIIQLYTLSVD